MPTELLLTRRGDMLVAADNDSRDAIRQMPEGKPLRSKVTMARNLAFHRKAFALVKLAFDYWQPISHVSVVEGKTVRQLHDYLIARGLEGDAVSTLCTDFLRTLDRRRDDHEFAKDFGAFRDYVTVEAGFFDTITSPAGPRRVPKSWAFGNMDEETFGRMYKAIFDVCWNLVLQQHFESPEAAEGAAMQLLSYS